MTSSTPDIDLVSADKLRRHLWAGYTPDTLPAAARAAFIARYGQQPTHITHGAGGIILAGPIPTLQTTIEVQA